MRQDCWTGTPGCLGIQDCFRCRHESGARKDVAIASLVRQIDQCNERMRTLEAQRDSLQRDLAAAQIQRDTAQSQVSHHNRRGW
jgi:chromosome segregation ATPase